MKRALTLLLLPLLFACNGDESTATTSSAPETNPEPTATAIAGMKLPTLNQQIKAMGGFVPAVATEAAYADITFDGPIMVVTSGNRRAVAVHDKTHTPYLSLIDGNLDLGELMKLFPNSTCKALPCHIDLSQERTALRLVGRDGGAPANGLDTTNPEFQHSAFGLGNIVKPLHADVLAELPSDTGPVSAYLELNGGRVLGAKYTPCKAKLVFPDNTESQFLYFNDETHLRMIFRTQAALEVQTKSTKGWKRFPISGNVTLRFTNGPANESSHFHLFGKLADPPIAQMPVVKPDPNCIKILSDDVPGCGNTQWP